VKTISEINLCEILSGNWNLFMLRYYKIKICEDN